MPVGPSRCAHPSPRAGTSPRTLATSNVMLSEGTEQCCGRRRRSAQETVRGAGRARARRRVEDGEHERGTLRTQCGRPGHGRRTRRPAGRHRADARRRGRRRRGRGGPPQDADGEDLSGAVEEPAKVMRIGMMIKQLLEEVARHRPRRRQPRPPARDPRLVAARARDGALARSCARSSTASSSRSPPTSRPRTGELRDRPGPARRLARGAVPRDPDRAGRPADGRPGAARADAQGPARRVVGRGGGRGHHGPVPLSREVGAPPPGRGAGTPPRRYAHRSWPSPHSRARTPTTRRPSSTLRPPAAGGARSGTSARPWTSASSGVTSAGRTSSSATAAR